MSERRAVLLLETRHSVAHVAVGLPVKNTCAGVFFTLWGMEGARVANTLVAPVGQEVIGDLNETVLIGDVDDESKHLCTTAYKCLQRGIETVKPGARYRDIGEEVTKLATQRKCSVVKSYCGHGIGTLFHCAPNIPHYAKNKAVGSMKEGHVFTIEPMINAGDWRDETWPDGWTAVTRDGKRSAQYEHTMVVTADGVEILTRRNEDSPRVFPWTDGESEGVVPGS